MSTTIRIQTTETQPFILLPTYVNGKGPFDFVLDTGAAMSILTKELADIIRVEGTEVKEALGAAGQKIEMPLGRVDSISIGEAKAEDVQVGITKELPKCVGAHGALGYNFLKGFVLIIDYESNLLTLTSPRDETSQARSMQTDVPLRLAKPDRPILLVDVLINAQETYPFILDTGASQTIVSPELAQRMGIGGTTADSIIGVGGAIQSLIGILTSLSIGEATLSNVPVIVADIFSSLSQAVGTKFDGVLGFNFLSNFKIEIDYPNERLRLQKLKLPS
jgi:predicted aspartyl protease